MAVELGSAYLSIGASTDGFSKDVNKALGNAERDAGRAGKRSGGALGRGLSTGLKVAGGAIAGVATLVGGLALKGGISRALNIEDAQAKLKGLGHDTKSIETIMDSALASVKGTAFGLGDAATVAASTVAAGVKPGEDLTRTLSLIGDAATIAGTSMGDMGAIFNKVAGTGKVQGEVIAQLGDRGIPILQLLADEMGVSAAEVGKLAAEGKVGFAEFQNAMEAGMGGAALESGNTFRGSLDNVMAAMGRVGEMFASPVLESLKGVFNDAIPAIDTLGDKLGPVAERFGEWLGPNVAKASEAFFGFISSIGSGDSELGGFMALLSPLGAVVKGLGPALVPLGEALGTLGASIGEALLPILPALTEALLSVVTAISPLVPVIGQMLVTAVQAVSPILAALAPIALMLVEAITPLLPPIVELVQQALPLFASILQTILGAITPLIAPLSEIVSALLPPLAKVITLVVQAAAPLLSALVSLVEAFLPIIELVGDLIATLLPPLTDILLTVVDTVIALAEPLIDALAPVLAVIGELFESLSPLIEMVVGMLGGLLEVVIPVVAALAEGLVGAIKAVVDWVGDVIPKVGEFASTIGTKIGEAIQWFVDLPGKILTALGNFGTLLLDSGKQLLEGLWNGISNAFEWVKEKITGIGSSILDHVKGIFGIRSPSREFAKIGRDLMRGLGQGVTDNRDVAVGALTAASALIAKAGEAAIKSEADRLIKARAKENARLRKEGRPVLPTLTREQATKQAKKSIAAQIAGSKAAQRLINAQTKRTGAGRADLLAGLTKSGKTRSGKAGRAIEGFTLADVAKARESVAKSIKAARDTLGDLKDARAQMRDQIASSIKGELDLTAALGQTTADQYGRQSTAPTTFKSVAGVVKAMATKAKTFAILLGRLRKAGIPAGLIQEVAGYGTEQGSEVARALLSGSATQIKELAADYSALEHWSDKAGAHVSKATFDTAIAAQQGLIAGLEADDAKLEKAAERLAKKLAKAVKKALGIKSPSRLFRDEIGTMLPAGIIDGIDDGQPALDARVAGMVPTPNVPTPRGMAGNEARNLTDADIQALADAFARTPIVARAYLDDREARKVTQVGIQEIRRTDPAVLGGAR